MVAEAVMVFIVWQYQNSLEQLSLSKYGYYATGHLHSGRAAVLAVVSAEFSNRNAVSVGDLLLSVDGVSTAIILSYIINT